jgi:ribosome-associated protein
VTASRPEDEPLEDRPSKSARKRSAQAAQDLGEQLIGLRDAELQGLGLPEDLFEAIREARRITSRGGGARQRQYIGKLMRTVELEPIHAALRAQGERAARDAEQFKRLEDWRERLIAEGAVALEELERWRPGLDRRQWTRLIAAAQAERAAGTGQAERAPSGQSRRAVGTSAAGRELFRALRTLFAGGS